MGAPGPDSSLDELESIAQSWRAAREREVAGRKVLRGMGLTLVGLAVCAAIGTQVQTHHTSKAIRALSRASVLSESAGDARQLYNSRRVKTDLFEIQRARIARELREVLAEPGHPRATYEGRLRERERSYEDLLAGYRREGGEMRAKAQSMRARAETRLEEGTLMRRRSNRLKDAVAWFQAAVAIAALGVVLRSWWIWALAVLAGLTGATLFTTALAWVT